MHTNLLQPVSLSNFCLDGCAGPDADCSEACLPF